MKYLLSIIALCATQLLTAQSKNKYGYPLSIMSDVDAYYAQTEADSNTLLVEIKSRIPNIVLDIRYATENNFLKKVFYTRCSSFG